MVQGSKLHHSVEITKILKTTDKTIFTAKTDEGYVGCVRKEDYVCFTVDVYDSVLKAANGARSLEKKLRDAHVNSKPAKDKKIQITTKSKKKKVRCSEKLYTLADTQAMPLLSFQEVWVIVRGEEYVSDCLNKEKKKLVSFTSERDKAKYFADHEKAKMTMRVLKGVVGPGFDLKRFFIQLKA
jgi:hypothetical protein